MREKCAKNVGPASRPVKDRVRKHTLAPAFLLLCAMAAHAADPSQNVVIVWADCGGEAERPCNQNDTNQAYVLLPPNTPSDNSENFNDRIRCDAGLQIHVNSDNTVRCVNYNRMKVGETDPIFNSPWLDFARQNQYGSIQADQPLVFAPILGTHNSYSNYNDGGDSAFSVDQGLSITDQLQLGARTIRLDPWLFDNLDNQIRLCHSSTGYAFAGQFTALGLCESVDWQGKALSRNRSFVYAIKEIGYWLRQHPSEVIVLRLHDFAQAWGDRNLTRYWVDTSGVAHNESMYGTEYYKKTVELEIGDLVYKNPTPGFDASADEWIAAPDDYRFPTIRQMRAASKQVLIVSAFPSEWAFEDASGSGDPSMGVTGTGLAALALSSPQELTVVSCDANNLLARPHLPGTFANMGEDRSISQLLVNNADAASTDYLLDAPKVRQALACGFNWLETDFLDTLSQAPNLNSLVSFFTFFLFPSNLPSSVNYTCDSYSDGGTCSQLDHRREAMIWSWAPGEGAPNQPARMTRGFGNPFGSWVSADASTNVPYLCASQQTVNGSSDASFPDNKSWYVTQTAGRWDNGETACQTEMGSGWHFWHPASAVQNMRAYQALSNSYGGSVATAWINHFQGGIQVLPRTMSFTMQQGQVPTTAQTVVVSGGQGGKLTVTADPQLTASLLPLYAHRDAAQTDNNDSNLIGIALGQEAAKLGPGSYNFTVSVHEDFTLSLVNPGSVTNTPMNSDASLIVDVDVLPNIRVDIESATSDNFNVVVDGTPYTTPHEFSWPAGSSHVVDASQPLPNPARGTRVDFVSWSDQQPAMHTIVVPSGNEHLIVDWAVSYQLTLNSTGPGQVTAAGQALGGGYYPAGNQVTITATPNQDGYFAGFSGALSGNASPQTLQMNGPRAVTAAFAALVHVLIPANAYGVPVTADGARYATPVQFQWIPGSSHTLSFPSWPLSTGKQAAFQNWSDGVADNPRTISAATATFTPVFAIQWLVTTAVSPSGAGSITPGGWVNDGTAMQFTATAFGGYSFNGFSGDLKGTTLPQSLTVAKPENVVANFTPASPRINVTGTVTNDQNPANVLLTLGLNNSGAGAVSNLNVAVLASVVSGSGTVTLPPGTAVVPLIEGGATANLPLLFTWPTSATRVRLTVTLNGNNGGYQTIQTLTMFR